jgi:prepilin-type N-terminal cleavage/methylation domain-containing protein
MLQIPGLNVVQNKGVSLVEVMVALTVLLIVFLGMIQTSIVAIQANMKNVLRDEAVNITAGEMVKIRAAGFDDLDENGSADAVPVYYFKRNQTKDFKGSVSVPFAETIRSELLDPAGEQANKQVTITTTWSWQGENFQHQILTTRAR